MKKIVFILFLFAALSVACASHAAKLPQGAYLEKYQWGALEDLLSDFRNNIISTNECALYGCYVLIAQEPSRSDSAAYAKLVPSKYDLGKISSAAGPYFFVKFLYDSRNDFNDETRKAFENSGWSIFKIMDLFKTDSRIKKIIDEIPEIQGRAYEPHSVSFNNVARKLIESKTMTSEEIFIVALVFNHNSEYKSIFKDYSSYFWRNHFVPDRLFESAYFVKMFHDCVCKSDNRDIYKIINYLFYDRAGISYAKRLRQGEYLDEHQWGALEDLLSDFRNNIISTNECALYGCYVLIAQEPSRSDSAAYAKLIPSKYDLGKISSAAGPYFFVKFLYDSRNDFNDETRKVFENSGWSIFKILDVFTTDAGIKKIIDETPKYRVRASGGMCLSIKKVARKIIENKLISSEEVFLVAKIFNDHVGYESIFEKYSSFFWGNGFVTSDIGESAYFSRIFLNHVENTDKKNIIKILNFLYYGHDNKYFKHHRFER